MSKEFAEIRVSIYRDSNGLPACAKDFSTGEVCEFYRSRNYGCDELCLFAADGDKLQRRNGGKGSLIPGKACKVWRTNL